MTLHVVPVVHEQGMDDFQECLLPSQSLCDQHQKTRKHLAQKVVQLMQRLLQTMILKKKKRKSKNIEQHPLIFLQEFSR